MNAAVPWGIDTAPCTWIRKLAPGSTAGRTSAWELDGLLRRKILRLPETLRRRDSAEYLEKVGLVRAHAEAEAEGGETDRG